MPEITQVLMAMRDGESQRAEELLPLVYQELRRLAAWRLSNEKPGQTLQATALVHEAYLRIAGSDDSQWNNRRHFFAAAAEAMRRILIEIARRKKRLKHGGSLERVDMEEVEIPSTMPDDDLLALDEALDRLAETDPRAAELVKLCFFVGLSLLLAGCATTPLQGRADLLNFLADGQTTRLDVIVALGQPSARFESDKVLTYRLCYEPKNHGYYVVDREPPDETGWSTWLRAKYSLVLVFDDAGVLRKHSLVEVN